jgi:hypothetical protein
MSNKINHRRGEFRRTEVVSRTTRPLPTPLPGKGRLTSTSSIHEESEVAIIVTCVTLLIKLLHLLT